MAMVVNLWSRKSGEIKRFLESFYEKQVEMDADVEEWIYVYKDPLNAIDLISAVMDNNDRFEISICIQVDQGDVYPVTFQNHNDIVKSILYLYYKEEIPECTY